ncbi:hypothetical protein [Polyangium sp. y55x31]|uniref:hypothetical protein n=1 Tax=Polyangium sp. y55x31 TaxID=3042688 RepID=UPI002482C11A|nr:hypothetical protein [Polyangium sp. y55x31]MDI1475410.1 hypothetical protein [Polyangium sp. y55x31]
MNISQIDRGVTYSYAIGTLAVTYLSGKDADATTPVFDMSVGEITLQNMSVRPINLRYDASQTRHGGHDITFGPHAQGPLVETEPLPHEDPPIPVDYDLAPGQKLLISRRDFMDIVLRAGVDVLQNGDVCTRFEAALQIDGALHTLQFGPHCFHVALDRDWELEKERYVQFFLDRDRRV